VELAFETRDIRSTCESPRRAKRLLGEPASLALQSRLADMRAARTPIELLAGAPKPTGPDRMRLNLGDGKALEFVSNHRRSSMSKDGVDWSRVTRVRIVAVGGLDV
jgi:hypothetical protein